MRTLCPVSPLETSCKIAGSITTGTLMHMCPPPPPRPPIPFSSSKLPSFQEHCTCGTTGHMTFRDGLFPHCAESCGDASSRCQCLEVTAEGGPARSGPSSAVRLLIPVFGHQA